MNLSPYELVLIAGGFTVIGALVGGWVGYKNALSIYNITEFNKAAAKFRIAFINQLNYLKSDVNTGSGDTSNIGEYLHSHYVSYHLIAFEVFRNYLIPKEKVAIGEAWEKYRNFAQYSDKNNETKMKKLALKHLKDVLKFAKHK